MVTMGVTAYNPDDEFYARQALGGQAKKNQNRRHRQPQNDDYEEMVDVVKNDPKTQRKPSSKHRRSSGVKTNPSKPTSSSTRRKSSSSTNRKVKQQRKRKKKSKKNKGGDDSSISSNPFDIVDDDVDDEYDTEEDEGLGVILGCDQRDDDELLADDYTAGCAAAAGDMILGKLDDGIDGDRDGGGDGSTNFGSGYFTLEHSNQDSSYTKPTVLNTTTEDLGATYAAMFEDDSNLLQAVVEMRMLPPPLTPAEIQDLENAFAGDYYQHDQDRALDVEKKGKNMTDVDDSTDDVDYDVEKKRSMIGLPKAKDFELRTESVGSIDNLHIESRKRRYRFLVPFILKAEINPGLAFGECLVTSVQALCAYSLFFHGFSFMISAIGGLSLFVALTITHFWYGFCRYPSLWNKHVPPGLEGIQMDRNFDEIRDICSYHCNERSDVHPQQMTAFLVTAPFTLIYHLSAFLFTSIFHGVTGIEINDERIQKRIVPSPITASIHASNFLVLMISSFGGPYGLIYATLVVHFNQTFYNSLLFRRKVRDFILSIFLGNLLIVHKKNDKRMRSTANDRVAEQRDSAFLAMEEGNTKVKEKSNASHSKTASKSNFPSTDNAEEDGSQSGETSTSDILMSKDADPQRITAIKTATYNNAKLPSNTDRRSLSEKHEVLPIIVDKKGGSSSSRRNPNEFLVATPMRRMTDSEVLTSAKINQNTVKDAPTEKLNESLSPSDVHIYLDNHPGTVAWRNIIAEAIQKFPVKSYTFRKHNWVTRKLRGRNFYSNEDGTRMRQLNRSQIKKYCKDHHDKQVEIQKQIVSILSDLSDVKKGQKQNIRYIKVLRSSKTGGLNGVTDEAVAMELEERASVEASSTKESVGDAESSSETLSTLTHSQIHSQIHFQPDVEEQNTPFTETEIVNAKCTNKGKGENVPSECSEDLTKTMYGVMNYSSLLDNLQKLSGDSPWNSAHQRFGDNDGGQRIKITPTHAKSPDGVFLESKNMERSTEKSFSQRKPDGEMKMNSLSPSNDKPTTTTHQDRSLNKQNSTATEGSLQPKRKIPLFRPLWKRALQKKKQSDQKSRNASPEKRDQRSWKRKSSPKNSLGPAPIGIDTPETQQLGIKEPELSDSLPDPLSMPTGSKEASTYEAILSMLDIDDEDSGDDEVVDVFGHSNSASTDMHSSGTWSSDGVGSDLRYYEEEMSDFHMAPQQQLKDMCNSAPFDSGTFGGLAGVFGPIGNPLTAFQFSDSHSNVSSTTKSSSS